MQLTKLPLATVDPTLECCFKCPAALLAIQLPANVPGKAERKLAHVLGNPDTHMGDPALAIVGNYGVIQEMEGLSLSLSLLLCLSNKQNKWPFFFCCNFRRGLPQVPVQCQPPWIPSEKLFFVSDVKVTGPGLEAKSWSLTRRPAPSNCASLFQVHVSSYGNPSGSRHCAVTVQHSLSTGFSGTRL